MLIRQRSDRRRVSPCAALNPAARHWPPAPFTAQQQPMGGRRPRAVPPPSPPSSGRVSLTLIGAKLLWERKFGKFHTSRSRAVRDINKTHTQRRRQSDSPHPLPAAAPLSRPDITLGHPSLGSNQVEDCLSQDFFCGGKRRLIIARREKNTSRLSRCYYLCGSIQLFRCCLRWIFFGRKMPADMMEKNASSPVAATPASMNTTPDKPKTASEHRKVGTGRSRPPASLIICSTIITPIHGGARICTTESIT